MQSVFPNSQQDRGIIILICSRSADQGSQRSSHPPQLTGAGIAGILQPHSLHASHARTHIHLLDSSTWRSIQISNGSGHSLIPSWTFPEAFLVFQVHYDVPQGKGSTVPQKRSVMRPNAFHESKGCWFAQSANDYMPPVQGATLGLETQR